VGWLTTASRFIDGQVTDYFSITFKLGQVKPHYTIQQVPGFTPQGMKMSADPSINEVKTKCSDISTPSYLYGIVAFISGDHLLCMAT
jgi:hypothetical protein